jgi:hypothetical protein
VLVILREVFGFLKDRKRTGTDESCNSACRVEMKEFMRNLSENSAKQTQILETMYQDTSFKFRNIRDSLMRLDNKLDSRTSEIP